MAKRTRAIRWWIVLESACLRPFLVPAFGDGSNRNFGKGGIGDADAANEYRGTSMSGEAGPPFQAVGGGCVCRGVRYTIDGPLRNVSNCHCEPCRRFTGHHTAATAVEVRHIIFDGTETLTWFESAPGVQYGFCGRCGSSLFWRASDKPASLSIMAGTLDQPTGLSTDVALFVDEHGDYHTPEPVDEALPRDRTV